MFAQRLGHIYKILNGVPNSSGLGDSVFLSAFPACPSMRMENSLDIYLSQCKLIQEKWAKRVNKKQKVYACSAWIDFPLTMTLGIFVFTCDTNDVKEGFKKIK